VAKANLYTAPLGGRWANRREGAKRVSKNLKTKAEAQAAEQDSSGIRRLFHDLIARLRHATPARRDGTAASAREVIDTVPDPNHPDELVNSR
jgi:hypothetical protein